jgi:hypothetical protein
MDPVLMDSVRDRVPRNDDVDRRCMTAVSFVSVCPTSTMTLDLEPGCRRPDANHMSVWNLVGKSGARRFEGEFRCGPTGRCGMGVEWRYRAGNSGTTSRTKASTRACPASGQPQIK